MSFASAPQLSPIGYRTSFGGAFTPASDPLNLVWWDPYILGSGATASWLDRIAGVAATQGTAAQQPVQSGTSLNGTPGVTGDGGDILSAAGVGPIFAGRTQLTCVMAIQDATGASTIAMEYTANAAITNGGFYLNPNLSFATTPGVLVRGTVGTTEYRISDDLSTARVLSFGMDLGVAGAGAIPFVRINGVTIANIGGGSASAAGSFANAPLNLFARSGPLFGYPGTLGNIIFRAGVGTGADLLATERYVGARTNLSF